MKTAGTLLLSFVLLAGLPVSAAAQGTVTFGGGANTQTGAQGQADANAPPAERDLLAEAVAGDRGSAGTEAEREWAERESKLNEAATLTGGVGLLHTQHAQGGAAGQRQHGGHAHRPIVSAAFQRAANDSVRDRSPGATAASRRTAEPAPGRRSLRNTRRIASSLPSTHRPAFVAA